MGKRECIFGVVTAALLFCIGCGSDTYRVGSADGNAQVEDVTIDLSSPSIQKLAGGNVAQSDKVSFYLDTTSSEVTFSCSLDGASAEPCFEKKPFESRWPQHIYENLSPGRHVFVLYIYEKERVPRFLSYHFAVDPKTESSGTE